MPGARTIVDNGGAYDDNFKVRVSLGKLGRHKRRKLDTATPALYDAAHEVGRWYIHVDACWVFLVYTDADVARLRQVVRDHLDILTAHGLYKKSTWVQEGHGPCTWWTVKPGRQLLPNEPVHVGLFQP